MHSLVSKDLMNIICRLQCKLLAHCKSEFRTSSRHGMALAECLPHLTGKVGQKWLSH